MSCESSSLSKFISRKRQLSVGVAAAVFGALALIGVAPGAEAADLSAFGACAAKLPPQVAASAECATLTVLENPARPKGRRIELPLLKLRSTGNAPGTPIFVFNGGPGEPNLGNAKRMALLSGLQADRDVYYLGYRGAEGSVVLTCPEIDALYGARNPLAPETLGKFEAASRACAARLSKAGYDLRRYTMLDVIADHEAAREALGVNKIDMLSASYGTRVAQIYARRHPGSIERSVMMATNPPGHFVFSAYANDRILRRLGELCSADPACAAKSPDLRRTVLNAIRAGELGKSTTLDDGKSRMALFVMLYRREGMVAFAKAAQAAEAGDFGPLAAMGEAVSMSNGQVWGDLMSKGGTDVFRYALMQPTFATTSESMGSPFDILNGAIGKGWPKIPFPEEYSRAAFDDTETLVLNGDIDIATPHIFVEAELMPYLRNGQLVLLKDYGHGDLGRLGPALSQTIAEYLRTGQVDRAALQPEPFKFQ